MAIVSRKVCGALLALGAALPAAGCGDHHPPPHATGGAGGAGFAGSAGSGSGAGGTRGGEAGEAGLAGEGGEAGSEEPAGRGGGGSGGSAGRGGSGGGGTGAVSGGSAGAGGNVCAGVDCSGHGTCASVKGNARCDCDAGYFRPDEAPTECRDVDECLVANGGCDPLTQCTNVAGGRACGDCPDEYTGDGETGCVAKACTGDPGTDCPCIRVAPDGDDAAAALSYGRTPFASVQLAIDFAAAHPSVSKNVCVASGEACCESGPLSCDERPSFSGSNGAPVVLRDGVSVYGRYESTTWTRCAAMATLVPSVEAGAEIQRPTTLDGFELTQGGVVVRGARALSLANVRVDNAEAAADWVGVDVGEDAQVALSNVRVISESLDAPASGEIVGVRVVGSEVSIEGGSIILMPFGPKATGLWLEDSPDVTVTDARVWLETYEEVSESTLVAVRIHQSPRVVLTDAQVKVVAQSNHVGIDASDSDDLVLSNVQVNCDDGEGDPVCIRTVRSPLQLDGVVSFASNGGGDAVLLTDSPGSRVSAAVSARYARACVHVTGDARGTRVEGSTLSSVGNAYASALLVEGGDATGFEVRESTISAVSSSAPVAGIEMRDCEGAEPLIIGNPSITVTGAGSSETPSSDAILAAGDCHPRIENNAVIRAATDAAPAGSLNAIRCTALDGTPSRCTIADNPAVSVGSADCVWSPTGTGIRCEGGSCSSIVGNDVTGIVQPSACLTIPMAVGVYIEAGGALIAQNVIRGGCGMVSRGLQGSGARVENNYIYGRLSDDECQTAIRDTLINGSYGVVGSFDLHSNRIDAGGSLRARYGCRSVAISGPSLARNNVLDPGICDESYGVEQLGTYNNNYFVADGTAFGYPDFDLAGINAISGNSGNVASGSLVNAGTQAGAPAFDFYGNRRDAQPDIGPVEAPGGPCLDVDCSGHGTCVGVEGESACICEAGYQNSPDDPLVCQIYDACAANGGCDPLTTCTPVSGGRACGPCPSGYSGDGETGCVPESEDCEPNPCQGGAACLLRGKRVCDCPPGRLGADCELTFVALSAGTAHDCGVLSDGTLSCWGLGTSGQSTAPSGTFLSVSAGDSHSCGLRSDGTLACWGSNVSGEATPPAGTFSSASAGFGHSCAVDMDGDVLCWGSNASGESSPPSGAFRSVAAGGDHSCGIRTDGTLACWGLNDQGQASPPVGTFTALAVGASHGCAVRTDGTLACWGRNVEGQSSPPGGTFESVSATARHSCALATDGSITCWGTAPNGKAPPTGSFALLTSGGERSCAVRADGSVACWGVNDRGSATPPGGAFLSTGVPIAVRADQQLVSLGTGSAPPAGTFDAVSAKGAACGIRTDGTLDCWRLTWGPTPSGTFTALATGQDHVCAIDATSGQVACGGEDDEGEGSPPPDTFTRIAAAGEVTCGVRSDATATCWGINEYGQLDVPSGPFGDIAVGYRHGCGVLAGGSVTCWGDDTYGRATPPSGAFARVAAGDFHNCALRSDRSVACWGRNLAGEATPPAGSFLHVDVGPDYSCGIDTDLQLRCWGAMVR